MSHKREREICSHVVAQFTIRGMVRPQREKCLHLLSLTILEYENGTRNIMLVDITACSSFLLEATMEFYRVEFFTFFMEFYTSANPCVKPCYYTLYQHIVIHATYTAHRSKAAAFSILFTIGILTTFKIYRNTCQMCENVFIEVRHQLL